MVRKPKGARAACPVTEALGVIGNRWTLLIVQEALQGTRRFGEFQGNLGLAKNILSARLKSLVGHGIFEAAPASDGSAYREYILTHKGRALLPAVEALRQWGKTFHVRSEGAARD
jgi:DNA-binding HxlR family transcriptional regulator